MVVLWAGSASAAGQPDLVEVSVRTPPSEVGAGMNFTTGDKVKNNGGARAQSSATGYYLSLDRNRSAGDIRLGRRSVPGLPAGQASKGNRLVTVPAETPLANYFVLACADDRKVVNESREGNNCRASQSKVEVRVPTCQEQLEILGVSFDVAPPTQGVEDPVTVHPPINGITYVLNGGINDDILMDCSLGLVLHEMGIGLADKDIDTVDHLGVYNYRCIGGTGTLPDCVLSQHAYGTAFDIAGFSGPAGDFNLLEDWVPDQGENTCNPTTTGTADHEFLRAIVCEWDADDLFNIILTPNYNDAHENHIHADLTPGADFID